MPARGLIASVWLVAVLILGCSGSNGGSTAWVTAYFKGGYSACRMEAVYNSAELGRPGGTTPIHCYVRDPNGIVYHSTDLTPDNILPFKSLFPITYKDGGRTFQDFGHYPMTFQFCDGKLTFLSVSRNQDGWALASSENGPWITFPASIDSVHRALGAPTKEVKVPSLAP